MRVRGYDEESELNLGFWANKMREVKENTVLLNLSNKKYFFRTEKGHYTIGEA